jgi:hypothetical protein
MLNLVYNVDGMGSSSAPMGERTIRRRLWNSPVLPKVCMFIWKLIRNGIPRNANRHYRHMSAVSSCEMCGQCYEDCFHAMIRCFHAAALHKEMSKWWQLPKEEDLIWTGPEWILVLMDKYDKLIVGNLMMILWQAWNTRNKVTRAGEKLSLNRLNSAPA